MSDFLRTEPESCEKCPKYIYKGDDEAYCRAARLREVTLQKYQKKPRWCPLRERRDSDQMPRVRNSVSKQGR